MAHRFKTANDVYLGDGALNASEEKIIKLGKKALIVTGGSMIKQGHINTIIELLERNGIAYAVYNGIDNEPDDLMINDGLEVYQKEKCNFLIGFGGGSQLDGAKAIAILVNGKGKLSDYMGKNINHKIPPLVMIPSTSGTGSETTPFTIINDNETNIKMLLKGDSLWPNLAIVEPSFSYNMPKKVTASSGLDALTHAIEAYTSRRAFAQSDMFALSAIKRIFKYLLLALDEDFAAREEMAIASYEAGVSFANSSVTIIHGMSRPIGALFHVPHGLSNAMLLPTCLDYVKDGTYERFADMARAIGIDEEDDIRASKLFVAEVTKLCIKCDVPSLAEYGVDKDKYLNSIAKMAKDAMASGSPSNTIKEINEKDIIKLYYDVYGA